MKLITWNCNGAFRKKLHLFDDFHADLLVIQECEDPANSTTAFRTWAGNYLWSGKTKNKGIGIFARTNTNLNALKWDDNGLQSFLPCKVDNLITLLAVWTKHAGSPNFRYIGQLWKYIQLHKMKMRKSNFVLCGDLNSNVCWDEWDRWWNHSDVVRELKEIGISSIYHRYYKEEQGNETKATLYHQRNLLKPYHVDYVFAKEDLFDRTENEIIIGHPDQWLKFSDHMPIIFTID